MLVNNWYNEQSHFEVICLYHAGDVKRKRNPPHGDVEMVQVFLQTRLYNKKKESPKRQFGDCSSWSYSFAGSTRRRGNRRDADD